MKVGMITLGCDKNRVDAEKILANLTDYGHIITPNPSEADAIIVNTCGFIDESKSESIDAIMDMAKYKEIGSLKVLIVSGCLAERYKDELYQIDGVDHVIPLIDNDKIVEYLDNVEKVANKHSGRVLTTPEHYAYLKIADGCDNCCTYCAIPKIRGRYKSTPIEKVVDEAQRLYDEYPTKELIVVAQDTTRYGIDLYGQSKLVELLSRLCELDYQWIRLLYCYPEQVTEELITFIKDNPKMCHYIDMPLQHINDDILKKMNRRTTKNEILSKISMIKSILPDMSIRSSFIIGFPGETQEQFDELCDFISKGYIDNAGFFGYSREEGTFAYNMKNRVPKRVINQRLKKIRDIQSAIMMDKSLSLVGSVQKVIYEGIDYDKQCFVGRTQYQAPEVDTKVYFTADDIVEIGTYYDVNIKDAYYDLIGEIL